MGWKEPFLLPNNKEDRKVCTEVVTHCSLFLMTCFGLCHKAVFKYTIELMFSFDTQNPWSFGNRKLNKEY